MFAIIAVVTFKLHGTATQVVMVLVSFMAQLAMVSPLAGVVLDRWHLKRTMIASDVIRGVLVLVHDLYGKSNSFFEPRLRLADVVIEGRGISQQGRRIPK